MCARVLSIDNCPDRSNSSSRTRNGENEPGPNLSGLFPTCEQTWRRSTSLLALLQHFFVQVGIDVRAHKQNDEQNAHLLAAREKTGPISLHSLPPATPSDRHSALGALSVGVPECRITSSCAILLCFVVIFDSDCRLAPRRCSLCSDP